MASTSSAADIPVAHPYRRLALGTILMLVVLSIGVFAATSGVRAEAPIGAPSHVLAAFASYSIDDGSVTTEGAPAEAARWVDGRSSAACFGDCRCGSCCHAMAKLDLAIQPPSPPRTRDPLATASVGPNRPPFPNKFRPPIA